nr:MAG TPA: hypothetical protein [Caudoviricetes sp.]
MLNIHHQSCRETKTLHKTIFTSCCCNNVLLVDKILKIRLESRWQLSIKRFF